MTRSSTSTNYDLASGIWTPDIGKAYRTAHRLRAGTVWINCCSVFDAAMPFGGYKESGWGREMGHNALDNYLETKSVVTQLAWRKPVRWRGPAGPAIAVTIKRRRHHESRCRS